MKTSVVPVVEGALGLITKGLEKYLTNSWPDNSLRIAEDYSPQKRLHTEKNVVHQVNPTVALGSGTDLGTMARIV